MKVLLVIVLSPFILLVITTLISAILETGFDMIIKLAIIAAIVCGCKYVFTKAKEGA